LDLYIVQIRSVFVGAKAASSRELADTPSVEDQSSAFPTACAPDLHFGLPISPLFFLKEICMPAWKVLFIVLMGGICLALALGTIVVPLTLPADENKWLWGGGLFFGTVCMGTLFALYLRREDRTFKR
jgi:hypothetical protein